MKGRNKSGFAALLCGKACLSENVLTMFRGAASDCRHSLRNNLGNLHGKASLTALESGKPQRNFAITIRQCLDRLLRQSRIAGALLAVSLLPLSFVFSQGANPDYSKFLHTSQQHSSIGCANCHHRNDNSGTPSFPGHKDCIECHRTEYHTAGSPICFICHQDVNGANPPRKAFPNQFKESFNLKFDHAQHMTGNARPKNGCASCHNASLRRGVAVSIPAGMGAHDGCYTCHTPDATANGREIASCGICHDQKAYTRTSNDSPAYRLGFSHAQHSGRQRLACADCHNYTADLPQRRQVSSPRALQHFPAGNRNCATCHNGKRTFGGDLDFKSCSRCHTGQTFRTGG